MINTEEKVSLIKKAMEDKKAENIKVIYIGEISVLADYFVICSAGNSSQMEAIIDNIGEELAKQKVFSKKTEGHRNSGWILMDYGDIIINLFTQEQREHYNIEKVWADCDRVYYEQTE